MCHRPSSAIVHRQSSQTTAEYAATRMPRGSSWLHRRAAGAEDLPPSLLIPTTMADLASQINQLTPEQRQAVMMRAKQEADQQVLGEMMKRMTMACFDKCAGSSVRCGAVFEGSSMLRRTPVSYFLREISWIVGSKLVWLPVRIDTWKPELMYKKRFRSDRVCRSADLEHGPCPYHRLPFCHSA